MGFVLLSSSSAKDRLYIRQTSLFESTCVSLDMMRQAVVDHIPRTYGLEEYPLVQRLTSERCACALPSHLVYMQVDNYTDVSLFKIKPLNRFRSFK